MKTAMKFLLITLLFSAQAWAEPLGEMKVSWTSPDNMDLVPYSTFEIKYVDSAGNDKQVSITDLASTERLITGVPFGPTRVWMTSTCLACTITESPDSNIVDHTVNFKGAPKSPGTVNISQN
jgi:hypothetical protein